MTEYEDVEEEYNRLKDIWKEETWHFPGPKHKATHWAYQRIIGLGPEAVPHIIDELREEPDHWFWALRAITGANPIEKSDHGDMEVMAETWIDWFEENKE